ncbi:uncharacterized protein LOC115631642 isoform X2 [Scaptodrosophila lebanonensis]|uniref:Uncharacterized protein LOC115631642 isoform X2 n=1 Tax=Drosophila lebanonensis TaxID=7225 RepID=A0A6J2UA08_DROLE|nr:uncharacterized protein LOC115631642 isoform X2 [Scaptodrosophila lebanonensis]
MDKDDKPEPPVPPPILRKEVYQEESHVHHSEHAIKIETPPVEEADDEAQETDGLTKEERHQEFEEARRQHDHDMCRPSILFTDVTRDPEEELTTDEERSSFGSITNKDNHKDNSKDKQPATKKKK